MLESFAKKWSLTHILKDTDNALEINIVLRRVIQAFDVGGQISYDAKQIFTILNLRKIAHLALKTICYITLPTTNC